MTSVYEMSVTKDEIAGFGELFRVFLAGAVRAEFSKNRNNENGFIDGMFNELDYYVDIEAPLIYALASMHITDTDRGTILLSDEIFENYTKISNIDVSMHIVGRAYEPESEGLKAELLTVNKIQKRLRDALGRARKRTIDRSISQQEPPKEFLN